MRLRVLTMLPIITPPFVIGLALIQQGRSLNPAAASSAPGRRATVVNMSPAVADELQLAASQ